MQTLSLIYKIGLRRLMAIDNCKVISYRVLGFCVSIAYFNEIDGLATSGASGSTHRCDDTLRIVKGPVIL